MSDYLRLFVAIDPPEFIRREAAALGEERPGFLWTSEGQLHLTLKFIGETQTALWPVLGEALAAIRVESFLLELSGLGFFPPRGHPSVLWTGFGTAHPRLFQLQHRVEDALYAKGIRPDRRAFHPHLTLARLKNVPVESVRQWIKKHADFGSAPFRVDGFALYASELRPEGAHHRILQRWELKT